MKEKGAEARAGQWPPSPRAMPPAHLFKKDQKTEQKKD
jgi:hypothetical protein